MNEWRRIFSDRRRRILMLLLPIAVLCIFLYQKCDGYPPALLSGGADYRAMLAQYPTPEAVIDAFSDNWDLTADQQRLLDQAEHISGYADYLNKVQEQAKRLQATSLFSSDPNTFVYRNILKTAKDFAFCTADGVRIGNFRAVQNWLGFSAADWAFLAAMILLVMSYLDERKKGLSAILRSSPSGRAKLQLARLGNLLLYSGIMTLLLYYVPLAVSLSLDGGWSDLNVPVQSVTEFRKCTVSLRLTEFLGIFFLIKTACGFLLGLLLWFFLSFLEQVQLCWLLTAGALAGEYILFTTIPPQSIFSPLRYINLFSYVFPQQLFTQYGNINFFGFPVGRRTLLLALLALLSVVLGFATVWVLAHRFPFGNRDRIGKWLHLWNKIADRLRRPLGLYGFEWYKLLFLSAGGLMLIAGILLTRDIRVDSGAYNRIEDSVYRQYVQEIQGPIGPETYAYLEEARLNLNVLGMDTAEFSMALDRVDETVAQLGEGSWLVDETRFLNIYGKDAQRLQRRNALLAMLFLVACLSPLYASEQNGDLRKVLRSAPGGRERLFRAKYAVALTLTALVWLLVFGREWKLAAKTLQPILAAPCASISMLRAFPGTIGTFLGLMAAFQLLALVIPTNLCMWISERSGGFEKSFLICGVVLLFPAAILSFGGSWVRWLTPMTFLADGNLLTGGLMQLPLFLIWAFGSIAALIHAKKHWSSAS